MSSEELENAVIIVAFQDKISNKKIEDYIADVIKNGGEIKDRYYESPAGIRGFSAIVKTFDTFKTFRADEINYIEADKKVVIQ